MENRKQWVSVADIQKEYLPLSKKKIRELLKKYMDVTNVGNKMLVERKQLEEFLHHGL